MAKFFRRGVSRLSFLPAVAAYTDASGSGAGSPTRAEINAGTALSGSLSEIAGFQLSNSPIPIPDLLTTFTGQINGEDTVDASVLTFYDDDASSTIRTALAKATNGFIVLFPYGDVQSKRCEVWPIRSTGVNDEWTTGNDPARFAVGCAVTRVPNQAGTVPGAV